MCSSVIQFPGHFLLLDIGNPITPNCVEMIRKSLLNILSLASCLKGTSRIPVFGCGVLKPELGLLQEWKFLEGNYVEIKEKLENIENSLRIGLKCTLGEYKHFLKESILKIVADFELKHDDWKLKATVKEQLDPKRYWPTKIVITLMTKKAALPIQEMLENVTLISKKLEKIEIVEVSSLDDDNSWVITDSLNALSCSFASENIWDLDAVFKKWLQGNNSECEKLKMVLDKKSGHHILCDVGCFMVLENMSNSQSTLQTSLFPTPLSYNNLISKRVNLSTWEMNVINKLKISDVCSAKLFGLAKIVYPTRDLRDHALQFNNTLFKALCAQLFEEQIGLLTRAGPDFNDTTAFYFIISDGGKLLIRNVIPIELQLPYPASEPLKISSPNNEDATFIVHSLLDRIETAREISPDKCSSGIYEHFKKHVTSKEEAIVTFEEFENEKCRKIKEIASAKTRIPPDERTKHTFSRSKNIKKLRKESGHYSKEKKFPNEVIHPALLSPGTTAKYRKFNAHKFLLPELLEPGVLEK